RRQASVRADFRNRQCVCRRGWMHAFADFRCHTGVWPGLYAARLRHCHYRRPGLHAGRAGWWTADRVHRGAVGPSVYALGQEHVRLCDSGARPAVPPTGHHGQGGGMIARSAGGLSRRGLVLLAVLLMGALVAPIFAGDYLLTVLILMLYFAYTGQA